MGKLNLKKPEIKSVKYYQSSPPNEEYESRADYVVINQQCVFTGTKSRTKTTINAVECVIAAIARQEGVSPDAFTYYDIVTNMTIILLPGEFEFERIEFTYEKARAKRFQLPKEVDETFHVVARQLISHVTWTGEVCPQKIIDIFARDIGPNPHQLISSIKIKKTNWHCQG